MKSKRYPFDLSTIGWSCDCLRHRVVVVTQQIDLSGSVGRLVASVLFGLAEIEQEYRRERQAAGITVAKRKGIYHGRLKGTTKAKPARAQALRARGLSAAEIANALRVGRRTVFRYFAMKNPLTLIALMTHLLGLGLFPAAKCGDQTRGKSALTSG